MSNTSQQDDYEGVSREGLIDMLEEASERMAQAESRLDELEAAGHICSYCGTRVGYSEDAVLEHIQSCDKRPEKQIESMYKKRIDSLVETLEEIEERIDERMGEWSIVAFDYLPENMEALYEIRQATRDAIAKARGES